MPDRKPKTRATAPADSQEDSKGIVGEDVLPVIDPLSPDRLPAGVPVLYADQVIDVIYGIHTSKIVLGLENGRGVPRPNQVVILPTAALLVAASAVLQSMGAPALAEETSQRLAQFVQMMRAAGDLTASRAKRPSKGRSRTTD